MTFINTFLEFCFCNTHTHIHTHINHTNTLIEYDIQAIHQNAKNDEFENLLKEIENFYSFDYARY